MGGFAPLDPNQNNAVFSCDSFVCVRPVAIGEISNRFDSTALQREELPTVADSDPLCRTLVLR
jgi:hypothetical protein